MSRTPKPQEIYKHFKGNLYQVITVAENSETGETMVVYQALYGTFKVYARPLDSFVSKVDKVKYPQVEQEYRFELQLLNDNSLEASDIQDTKKHTKKLPDENQKNVCDKQVTSACGAIVVDESSTQVKSESHLSDAGENGEQAESVLDPMVWEFLDAESHEARLNILAALHHRITDDMITTMAVACDIEVADGELEERYSQLKNCLQMLDRFEIRRN